MKKKIPFKSSFYQNFCWIEPKPQTLKRIFFVGGVLSLSFILILARYAQLSIFPSSTHQRLLSLAESQFEKEFSITPFRGNIVDRKGRLLATSIKRPSLFVMPKKLISYENDIKKLSQILKISEKQFKKNIPWDKGFAWLLRQTEYETLEKIKKELPNWESYLGVIEEHKRVYPQKDLASHLIGFVNIDNKGMDGIEKLYDKELSSTPQKVKVMKDARGQLSLLHPHEMTNPHEEVKSLELSIDIVLQNITQKALEEAVKEAKADGGSAIVLDSQTNEVLAIASYPYYDLNKPIPKESRIKRFRSIADGMELGSVVKPLFIAKALEEGLIREDSTIFCENGVLKVPGGRIRDTHSYGELTVGEIIKVSSNIGTYKVVQKLGKEKFYHTLVDVGLFRYPGTGLPGEIQGRVAPFSSWREMRFANMAFGQGFASSPLQLTNAFSTLVHGNFRSVSVLHLKEEASFENPLPLPYVYSPSTSQKALKMLEKVVEEKGGTGSRGRIEGIRVGGKTGTAQKVGAKTGFYSEKIVGFVGVIPIDDPKLIISVFVDEPKISISSGGKNAAPAFAKIGLESLKYLNATESLRLSSLKSSPP